MEVVLKKSEAAEPFTFRFIQDEKVIIKSENYKAKKSALNGIESVKKNSVIEARYELKISSNDKYFFNLKSSNGQVVGTSPLFATEQERDDAINTLIANADEAALISEV